MKRRPQGLSFLGFVALADMIFAVSAGLLLLNPLRLDDLDEQEEATLPQVSQLTADIKAVEHELARTEEHVTEVGRALQVMLKEETR